MSQLAPGGNFKFFGWFLFLLMSLLPALGLIGIATLFIHDEKLNEVALFAVFAIAVISLLFIAVGLYLLLRLTESVQNITSSVAGTAGELYLKEASSSPGSPEKSSLFDMKNLSGKSDLRNLRKLEEDLSTLQDVMPARLALLEEEAGWARMFKTLLESADSMIIVLDNENFVHYANELARRQWGVGEEQTLEQSLSHSNLEENSITELLQHIQSVSQNPTTLTLWRQDNQKCVLRFEGVSVPGSSMPVSKGVILRDVTFIENLKNVFQESYGQTVAGRLVSGVAHELNNPLSAVLGFAELAEASTDTSSSESVESTTIIKREVQKASYLVENLLNFARPSPHQASSSDLHEALERCLSLLSYRLRSQRILVSRDYETNLPRGKIKNYQLQQALMNVFLNALEAVKENDLENRRIEIKTFFESDRRSVCICISDSGPGLPLESRELHRLFEPFFSCKTDDGNAIGLGLAIAREVLRGCGGELTADNSSDGGGIFRFELPIEQSADVTKNIDFCERWENEDYAKFRMLAVSRDCNFLENLEVGLSRDNIHIETVAFINDAMNLLANYEFNVGIVDCAVDPGSEQILWECIVQNQPALAGNLLFATSVPELSEKLANKLGIEPDTLLKPIKPDEAREKILKKLNGNAA